ncbi:MAG: acyl carrier protein [Chloroflexi bacterium]|nr:acyl carrier protein [Chloroflexota bacterium]
MASMNDVKTLIADQLGLDDGDVQPDSRIVEDLGAESSDVANIMAAIQDRYGIKVSEDQIAKFITVSDVYLGIQQHSK